jgi:hypothetical protein
VIHAGDVLEAQLVQTCPHCVTCAASLLAGERLVNVSGCCVDNRFVVHAWHMTPRFQSRLRKGIAVFPVCLSPITSVFTASNLRGVNK